MNEIDNVMECYVLCNEQEEYDECHNKKMKNHFVAFLLIS